MTSKYGILLKANQKPGMLGYINNILHPIQETDPTLAQKPKRYDYTYGEDGRRGKRYRFAKAEEEDHLMIPHYQRDGSCTVKSVNEYLQMHTFKDDEDYNEDER